MHNAIPPLQVYFGDGVCLFVYLFIFYINCTCFAQVSFHEWLVWTLSLLCILNISLLHAPLSLLPNVCVLVKVSIAVERQHDHNNSYKETFNWGGSLQVRGLVYCHMVGSLVLCRQTWC